MKKINSKSLLFLMLLQCFLGFAQEQVITGKITDVNNMPLPGASIIEKGTKNGAMSTMDGDYTIELKNPDAILVFHYIGFKTVEYSTAGKTVINVKMETDSQALDEVTLTVGIRSSQLNAVREKREATSVIEAITPEDIGSFSDGNVTDALQRVAGVQIERNDDGVSGDRVSIRGIGPQFVKITMNGRAPISAGNEGKSDFRKFNLNVIPTEIINGARIHKTTQAKEIATDIGGTVDFQTLRPLDARYKRGKNYFASVNLRGDSDSEFEDIDFDTRISGVFGGKINDKLGAAVSIVHTDDNRYRDESGMRGYRNVDFYEDTNSNGVFEDGENVYEGILVPATINNAVRKDNRKQLALSAAIQYKPTDKLEFLLDYTLTKLEAFSDRQQFQTSLSTGGDNGLLGVNNFFTPESLVFNGNNLAYIDAAGADVSRVNIQNKNQFYTNNTTNNILGLNTLYKESDKLTFSFDLSYSDLDFFQDLTQITARLDGRDYDNSAISLDLRGELPQFGLPTEILDPTAFGLRSVSKRHIRTNGYNYASRLDVEYELNKKVKFSLGARSAITDFEAREAQANADDIYGDYTDEQLQQFVDLISYDNYYIPGDFLGGGTGLDQWINIPGNAVLDLTPGFNSLNGGSIFDFDKPIDQLVSQEGDLQFNPAKSYGAIEKTFSTYAQVDARTTVFNIPVVLNFGVRAINTINESRGFTGVEIVDPIAETSGVVSDAIYHEVENSRWDVLPSFNANFKIKRNFNLRFSAAKGASRPKYRDMMPSNEVEYLDPTSEIFNPSSPDYEPNLGTSLYRGTIKSGNPKLEPYSAWMYDTTFELYSRNGGAIIGSIFYKDIKNYIGRQTLNDQAYPGIEALGVAIPAGQEDLLFDISTPINITNAQLYGFEIGFNHHFTFLPGFASGFGLRANYSFVESNFDGAVGDATNGFPGTSKHNFNTVMYYEKYGFSFRFTAAYRSNYLSNLGGIGSTRADEAHYTEGTTLLGINLKYKITRKIQASAGVSNLTGEDTRRYIGDDTQNLTSYYGRTPTWKVGLRYRL
ncbi:TonB-dependent receptor [Winogradskyella psychrotolerans RS-3]|uniref:TonB-dependent receptor n=1 Tax=Winogradskyella psychrotolerans RS-3 TaxID=641526 RepID=S7X2D0_9FLAO|nr:TonB-dependent receptor [Winogradskyella psychrotolerans]EPR73164.1 TonB-dependent receptor [Winogradskyella psychrotolerans RS-3]